MQRMTASGEAAFGSARLEASWPIASHAPTAIADVSRANGIARLDDGVFRRRASYQATGHSQPNDPCPVEVTQYHAIGQLDSIAPASAFSAPGEPSFATKIFRYI